MSAVRGTPPIRRRETARGGGIRNSLLTCFHGSVRKSVLIDKAIYHVGGLRHGVAARDHTRRGRVRRPGDCGAQDQRELRPLVGFGGRGLRQHCRLQRRGGGDARHPDGPPTPEQQARASGPQAQFLCYSTDGGRDFRPYGEQPVIPNQARKDRRSWSTVRRSGRSRTTTRCSAAARPRAAPTARPRALRRPWPSWPDAARPHRRRSGTCGLR